MNAVRAITSFMRGAWIGGAVGLRLIDRRSLGAPGCQVGLDGLAVVAITGVIGPRRWCAARRTPNAVLNFVTRLTSIFEFGPGAALTRPEIWEAAYHAIKARPLLGFGADTFRLVFPKYKPVAYHADAGYLSVADNVHNYPLQLATGIGIPGVLMMYGIFGWAAVRSFGTVFNKTDDKNRILVGAFWAACAGYLLQLMTGLSVTGNTFLLWAAMAVVLAPTASIVELRAPKWGNIAAGVLIFLFAVGIGYQFVIMAADRAYLTSRIGATGPARTAAALGPFRSTPSTTCIVPRSDSRSPMRCLLRSVPPSRLGSGQRSSGVNGRHAAQVPASRGGTARHDCLCPMSTTTMSSFPTSTTPLGR